MIGNPCNLDSATLALLDIPAELVAVKGRKPGPPAPWFLEQAAPQLAAIQARHDAAIAAKEAVRDQQRAERYAGLARMFDARGEDDRAESMRAKARAIKGV